MGITGHHDPEILISAIKRHDFDTVLLCANAGDSHYLPFITTVIPEARKKKMGIIAMKVTAQGNAFPNISMKEALYFTFSRNVDLAIVGCRKPNEVEENAELAKGFAKLSKDELKMIESKTKNYSSDFNFFKKGGY